MSIRCIVLNGPARSGKDTLADWLVQQHPEVFRKQKFATPLKMAAHALLGLSLDEDAFENVKDQALAEFFGMTPRDFYIALSERFLKPITTMDVFGHVWLREYESTAKDAKDLFGMSTKNQVTIIPDCGFKHELLPLLNYFGEDQMLLLRIYRKGFDYNGDSRSYISDVMANEIEVVNINDEPQRMLQQVEFLLSKRRVYADFWEATRNAG